MTVNGIEITQDTIIATRKHFADSYKACIIGAMNGDFRVNNLGRYIEWQENSITNMLNGDNDHTLAFIQRALYLQTGNCIAILP